MALSPPPRKKSPPNLPRKPKLRAPQNPKTSRSPKPNPKAQTLTTDTKEATPPEPVKLLIRLDFSSHEKLSEQRWIDRIPTEDPFQAASPKLIKPNDAEFGDTEKQFEDLA